MRRARQGAATEADLSLALDALENSIAVIGLTERYVESILLFAHAFAHKAPPRSLLATHTHDATRRSVGARRLLRQRDAAAAKHEPIVWNALSSDTAQKVRRAVELDAQFHERAMALFDRQLAVAPAEIREAATRRRDR